MADLTHILIIDDDPDTRRFFGARLSKEGYEILYAHDGNEGREMARRYKPDLILLDVRLPIMDGMEVANRLKNESPTSQIPIAFLTNEDFSPEVEKMVKNAWVVDYIHKGVDPDELAARVKKILKSQKK